MRHAKVKARSEEHASYRWFDLKDREYQDCRLKISGPCSREKKIIIAPLTYSVDLIVNEYK